MTLIIIWFLNLLLVAYSVFIVRFSAKASLSKTQLMTILRKQHQRFSKKILHNQQYVPESPFPNIFEEEPFPQKKPEYANIDWFFAVRAWPEGLKIHDNRPQIFSFGKRKDIKRLFLYPGQFVMKNNENDVVVEIGKFKMRVDIYTDGWYSWFLVVAVRDEFWNFFIEKMEFTLTTDDGTVYETIKQPMNSSAKTSNWGRSDAKLPDPTTAKYISKVQFKNIVYRTDSLPKNPFTLSHA